MPMFADLDELLESKSAKGQRKGDSAKGTDLFSKNEFVPSCLKKAARQGIIASGGSCG
jgi:shikimate kinase